MSWKTNKKRLQWQWVCSSGKVWEAATCWLKALVLTVIKQSVYIGQTPASCLHLIFVCCFFSPCIISSAALSLGSQGCWSLVNEYLALLPHGEPDMLARFYGPFQSCPGLNTASCWPHGRNVVPCPSGKENWGTGGHLDLCQKCFSEATSICDHVEATWRKIKFCRFWVAVLWPNVLLDATLNTSLDCIPEMIEKMSLSSS